VPAALPGDEGGLAALNKAVMETLQAEGQAFLTGTMVGGRFALRACVLHYDTTEEDVRALVDLVRRTGARLAAGRAG
jgi:aromatic-L-amino-acid/L-tryptophan decarboxylase